MLCVAVVLGSLNAATTRGFNAIDVPPQPPVLAPVPGIQFMASEEGAMFGRGFDPLVARHRQPVLDFHFSEGEEHVWGQPETGRSFKLPDEVFIYDIPASQLDCQEHQIHNYTEYKHYEYSYRVCVVFALIFAFAEAEGHGTMKWALSDTRHLAQLRQRFSTSFKVDVPQPAVLKTNMQEGGPQSRSTFAREQNLLPETLDTQADHDAYNQFIQRFGTHYVSSAVFGSSLSVMLLMGLKVATQMKVDFSAQAEAVIAFILITFGYMEAHTDIKVSFDALFKQNADLVLTAFGGDPTKIAAGDYKGWADTVPLSPAPINVTYTDIHELVVDPTKAGNLRKVVAQYLEREPGDLTGIVKRNGVCAAPPGFNLSFAEIPKPGFSPALSHSPAAAEVDLLPLVPDKPPILPQLASSQLGYAFDVGQGVPTRPLAPAWAFNTSNIWFSPYSKRYYALPDALSLSVTSSACLRFDETVIANLTAFAEFKAKMTWCMISIPLFMGLHLKMTFKKEQASFHADVLAKGMARLVTSFEMELFSVDHASFLSDGLDTDFSRDVAALPPTHGPEYGSFVDKWGSHYVSSQGFGGYCTFAVEYDATLHAEYSWEVIKHQGILKLLKSLLHVLKVPTTMLKEIEEALKNGIKWQFFNKSTAAFNCSGGDPTLLGTSANPTPGGYDPWLKSLSSNPAPITQNPRLSLITDFVEHKDKREFLLEAIVANINNGTKKIKGTDKTDAVPHIEQPESTESGCYVIRSPAALPAANIASFQRCGFSCNPANTSCAKMAPCDSICHPASGPGPTCEADGLHPGALGSVVDTATGSCKPGPTSPTPAPPPLEARAQMGVPGVCTGWGDVGVGCGYDVTQMEAFGMTINPKKPVVHMPACASKCYALSNTDPECEHCTYVNPFVPNVTYRVPSNVMVLDNPSVGGCYEGILTATAIDYNYYAEQDFHHHGFFHSWSHTYKQFMHEYYEKDRSMSLFYKSLVYHTVSIADLMLQPTPEFRLATLLLPREYDADAYGSFIQDYGTHVMDQASMGGAALLTSYFHSCFISEYSGYSVKLTSESSFFFFYHESEGKGWGSNISHKLWDEWSTTQLKLLGGDANKHGQLEIKGGQLNTTKPFYNLSSADAHEWENSIKDDKMVPLQYHMIQLDEFMQPWASPAKVANVKRAIADKMKFVNKSNEDFIDQLIPKDPYVKPSWCKFDPHPPPPPGQHPTPRPKIPTPPPQPPVMPTPPPPPPEPPAPEPSGCFQIAETRSPTPSLLSTCGFVCNPQNTSCAKMAPCAIAGTSCESCAASGATAGPPLSRPDPTTGTCIPVYRGLQNDHGQFVSDRKSIHNKGGASSVKTKSKDTPLPGCPPLPSLAEIRRDFAERKQAT